jgi:hypothetical protein
VKVKLGNDIRRFSVKSDVLLQNFRRLVADLYHLTNFILQYQDDEGDCVNIKTDTDLTEAIRLALLSRSLILRIEVHPVIQKSLDDSTWIVVPDETIKTPEFPSIFGFQIPQLESNSTEIRELEDALKHFVLVEGESKTTTNTVSHNDTAEYVPVQSVEVVALEEKFPETLPANNHSLNVLEIQSEIQKSNKQMPQLSQESSSKDSPQTSQIEHSSPPKKRLSEMCSDLSSEIKSSCLYRSNETLQDMLPCWKSTVSNCLANSLHVRNQCLTEVQATRDLMQNLPAGIVQSSNIISAATTANCNLAASSVISDCKISQSETSQSDLANKQLSELSRECKELSASIRASIMAM